MIGQQGTERRIVDRQTKMVPSSAAGNTSNGSRFAQRRPTTFAETLRAR
jgi:hypothetical protein